MTASVSSVVHAFAIIRALAGGRTLTLSEVARECGISPSTCLGLLRTLVGEGVLALREGKRYCLKSPWSGIVETRPDQMAHLLAMARRPLEKAARKWSAPVGLWRVIGRDRLQLAALGQSPAATRIHMEEGLRQPIGSGSVGRALAAVQNVSRDELLKRYSGVRWHAPMTEQDYLDQIAQAKLSGFALDNELTYAGITSVAVCLSNGLLTFCLSGSVFAGSRTIDELAEMAEGLSALGAEIFQAATRQPTTQLP